MHLIPIQKTGGSTPLGQTKTAESNMTSAVYFCFLCKEKACGARIAHRRCVILTKDARPKRGQTVKEKTEPGTRIASGLSLVDAKGVEPSTSAMRMQHSPN